MIMSKPREGTEMNASASPALVTACRALRHWLIAVLAFGLVSSALAAEPRQRTFASPEEAASQLMAAAASGDVRALLAILGPDAKPILQSGDAVADKEGRARFVRQYEEANRLESSGDGKVTLAVGKDAWPFPVPIVKSASGWRFDTKAGRQEILNRRIGRNELSAMQAALAYVDAQREYYLANPQREKLLQYAQRFVSTENRRDGLYWRARSGEQPSPLGPLFARARTQGYDVAEQGKSAPYHGYHYRILKAQGPDAAGGAYDYVVRGRMIGGFALIAFPATYGNSGIMTFIVNHDGVLYQKDLGPQTSEIASKITRFNPDTTWREVK